MSLRSLLAPGLLTLHRALSCLAPAPPGAVRLLVIHDVPPGWEAPLGDLLDHCAERFGFVTPSQAEERLSGAGPADGGTPVLLTFDDGFASNFRVAETLLAPRGIKALFFVCPGLVDLPADQRDRAVAEQVFRRPSGSVPPLMEWSRLRELAAQGHGIAAHSLTHARLSGLPAAELERQVGGAKARLEQELDGRVASWFAFPFGDMASIDPTAIAAIGRHYRFCRSGVRGMAHAATPLLALPAESVDLSASRAWAHLAAEGGLAPLYRRQRAALRRWSVAAP